METKERDNLVNVAFINFYTLGKTNPHLLLGNINVNDKRHLACIHIAKLVRDMYGYEFYAPNSIINYWKLSWKCRSKKWLKRVKSTPSFKLVNVEDFIFHIEKANNQINGFAEIYDEYFKEFDR